MIASETLLKGSKGIMLSTPLLLCWCVIYEVRGFRILAREYICARMVTDGALSFADSVCFGIYSYESFKRGEEFPGAFAWGDRVFPGDAFYLEAFRGEYRGAVRAVCVRDERAASRAVFGRVSERSCGRVRL